MPSPFSTTEQPNQRHEISKSLSHLEKLMRQSGITGPAAYLTAATGIAQFLAFIYCYKFEYDTDLGQHKFRANVEWPAWMIFDCGLTLLACAPLAKQWCGDDSVDAYVYQRAVGKANEVLRNLDSSWVDQADPKVLRESLQAALQKAQDNQSSRYLTSPVAMISGCAHRAKNTLKAALEKSGIVKYEAPTIRKV